MARDYEEHLNPLALGLLAETTGRAARANGANFFRSRPHDINIALAAPEATDLLRAPVAEPPGMESEDEQTERAARRILQLAIAVHQVAEELFHVGWSASDRRIVDLSLLRFCSQSSNQRFLVGLLASFLTPGRVPDLDIATAPAPATSERLFYLADLASTVAETEHAGVLRLLGDEALFAASVFPDIAHECALEPNVLRSLQHVLPSTFVRLISTLDAPTTLLDLHLMLGPIWYRMAARNLLLRVDGDPLEEIADNFGAARMFLVHLVQGPLAQLRQPLYGGHTDLD